MSNLPPGCTDAMCDGVDSSCANCGHEQSMHYDEGKQECDQVNCNCEGFVEGEYEPPYDEDREYDRD